MCVVVGLSLTARRQLSGVMALLVVLLCASVALAKPRRKRGRGKVQASSAEVQAEKAPPVAPDPYAGIPASRLQEAKRRFEEAVQLEEDGNHEAAIVEFDTSYKLVPRPNTLYNLGLVHEKLFRYDQAIDYYELYLKRAPKDDPDLNHPKGVRSLHVSNSMNASDNHAVSWAMMGFLARAQLVNPGVNSWHTHPCIMRLVANSVLLQRLCKWRQAF